MTTPRKDRVRRVVVNEVTVTLPLNENGPPTVRELERYCEALRNAGADGGRLVHLEGDGDGKRLTVTVDQTTLPRAVHADGS